MGRLLTRLFLVLFSLGAIIGAVAISGHHSGAPVAAVSFTEDSIPSPHYPRVTTHNIKPSPMTYTVVSGDTLSGIAQHFSRSWQNFAGYNHLSWAQAQSITPGQVLKIPPGSYVAPALSQPVQRVKTVSRYGEPTKSGAAPILISSGGWSQPWACIAEGVRGGAKWGNGESGGNPADTPNGPYYGGLQFAMSTWLHNGGVGNPAYASIAEQEAVADTVLARAGWGQWPQTARACGYL